LIDEAIDDHRVIKNLWERYQKEKDNHERQKIGNTILRESKSNKESTSKMNFFL